MSTQHAVVVATPATTNSPFGFRKSSFCGEMNCVEVAATPSGDILVRNTNDSEEGPVVRFTLQEWDDFLSGVAAGEFSPATMMVAHG